MRKFLLKRLLPFLASQVEVDIDTVERSDGKFLRVRVEVLGMVVLDKEVKLLEGAVIDERLSKR